MLLSIIPKEILMKHLTIIFLLLFTAGCFSPSAILNRPPPNPAEAAEAASRLYTLSDEIKRSSDKISQLSPRISGETGVIIGLEAGSIGSKAEQIRSVGGNVLEYSQADHVKIEKIEKLQDELKNERSERSKIIYIVLSLLSVVGIGIIIYAVIVSKSVTDGSIGLCVLAVSLAIMRYIEYIAWAGLAILIFLGFQAVKTFLDHKKTKIALEETVQTTEAVKGLLNEDDRTKLFGDGALVGFAEEVQGQGTKEIVSKLRKKLAKKKWEKII
jgi:hypothetical protein